MTVTIKNVSNGAGFGAYTIGNRLGATVVMGDVVLGDEICHSINYKSGNSINFVISFSYEDGVNTEQGRKIAKEFMQSFMQGFNEDEYHLDLVEHTDSPYLHYHARVPKLNLLTGTQLKLYWHKTDLEYKKAVINDICQKYDLFRGEDMQKTVPNPSYKLNRIQKWRERHNQEPFDLRSPKLRKVFEHKLREYFRETIEAGLINNLDEVKKEIVSWGLDIVNEGYDKGKDFHYLTIQNESGKMRIRGDIYNAEFYELTREDRAKSVSSDESFRGRNAEYKESGTDAKHLLPSERRKRLKFIEKQYGGARERAYQRKVQSIISDIRETHERDVARLGKQNEEHPRSNVKDASADIQRGRESLIDTKEDVKQEHSTDKGYDAKVGGSKQRESQLQMALDNNVWSMDGRHRMGNDLSQPKPTTTKERREEANPRGSERVARREIHDTHYPKWLAISNEEKGELGDRTRAKISNTIRATAESFYAGAREDISLIHQEHERSQSRDNEAITDIKALRKSIYELADKHQSRTARRVGENGQEEVIYLDGAVSQVSKRQSDLNQEYAGFKRGLQGAIRGIREKARGISQTRQEFSGAIKRCIEKAIEKVREVSKTVQRSYRRGPTMMP